MHTHAYRDRSINREIDGWMDGQTEGRTHARIERHMLIYNQNMNAKELERERGGTERERGGTE